MLYPDRKYRDIINIVPPGKVGKTEVRHAHISQKDSDRTFLFDGSDAVVPGTYCQLWVDGGLFMTDTPAERRTNRPIIENAHGDVLIGGLGVGLILPPLILAPEVTSITVLEQSPAVLELVAPSYKVDSSYWAQTLDAYRLHKLRFVEADVFRWRPDQKFQTIWFDIWPSVDLANLPEMVVLRHRYAQYLQGNDHKPWFGCWCEPELKESDSLRKVKDALW